MDSTDIINRVSREVIKPIITLLITLAVLYFLYGFMEFFTAGDNEEKRTTGKQHMLWGIIGLFIMVSATGILNLICTSIGC